MKSVFLSARLALAAASIMAALATPQMAAAASDTRAQPATEAEHLERIAAFERAATPTDSAYLTALSSLGHFYVNRGRYADAVPVLRRGLAASERIIGPEHQVTREFRSSLALAEAFVGRR